MAEFPYSYISQKDVIFANVEYNLGIKQEMAVHIKLFGMGLNNGKCQSAALTSKHCDCNLTAFLFNMQLIKKHFSTEQVL
jgi:hypothetical protein